MRNTKYKNSYLFWSVCLLVSLFLVALFVVISVVVMNMFENLTYKIITGFLGAILLSNLLSKFIVTAHKIYADRYDHLHEELH